MWVTSSLADVLTPTAIALGNFDGIHLGHQSVLRAILPPPILPSDQTFLYPTVVTFHPHPKAFFTGENWKLLTPLAEKIDYLSALGIKQLVRLPFNARLAALSPQDFVQDILVDQLQARRISIGADFCFGYQRQGTALDLKAIAKTYDIDVTITPLLRGEIQLGDRISSSRIRAALAIADLPAINQMLGRPYRLQGTVVLGQQLGRTLGFPTANLQLPPDKLLPRQGVYAVRVTRGKSFSEPETFGLGVMNVGSRPTLAGQSVTVEVHLLDWSGDLYGQTLTVSLETFLRSEEKFPSLNALQSQIMQDCQQARQYFGLSG